MEIRTIVSMTDIHEYAKQQLSLLEGTQHTALKLTYYEKEWNARVNGQIMAWQHVLRVEWTNPHEVAEDDNEEKRCQRCGEDITRTEDQYTISDHYGPLCGECSYQIMYKGER